MATVPTKNTKIPVPSGPIPSAQLDKANGSAPAAAGSSVKGFSGTGTIPAKIKI